MEITPKIQRILDLANEKTAEGHPRYVDIEIANIIGCTRQYIAMTRKKYGLPTGWQNSVHRRFVNRIQLPPEGLDGKTVKEVAEALNLTYPQALVIIKAKGIKVVRQKPGKPVSGKLPTPDALLEEKKAGNLSWKKLAERYQVSAMTLHRHIKRNYAQLQQES